MVITKALMTFDSSFGGIVREKVLREQRYWEEERLFSKVRNTRREANRG